MAQASIISACFSKGILKILSLGGPGHRKQATGAVLGHSEISWVQSLLVLFLSLKGLLVSVPWMVESSGAEISICS